MKYRATPVAGGPVPRGIFAACVLCSAIFGFAASGQEAPASRPENVYEMSLEQAINTEIVSASRQSRQYGELTASVTVITAEDIHYSGLTTIPEILQFAAGVDVFELDRNRYSVGVRGLHDYTSDRVLILINGRRAESPFFGGSEFYRYPVMVEDIARIEIVRGPGGATWGANAFNGVINIITKKPSDVRGAFASETITGFGDSYTHLRWAQVEDKWQYRISAEYSSRKASDEAGAGNVESFDPAVNDLIRFETISPHDWGRSLRFDTEALYSYSARTSIGFGLAYSRDDVGPFEFGGYSPTTREWLETARPFIRIDHDYLGDVTGSLQWYGNFSNSWVPSLFKWRTYENDVEAQLNFEPADAHKTSVGANVHLIRVNSTSRLPEEVVLPDEPYDEWFAGLFATDRWEATDRLAIEAQLRGDKYSETQTDWSSRLSALVALDGTRNHILRFSAAKAFRAPLAALRQVRTSRLDVDPFNFITPDPGPFGFNVVPNDRLRNEEIYSWEIGYTGQMPDNLTIAANTYYQTYQRLIGYENLPNPFGLTYRPDNIDGATAYGAELEITKKYRNAQASAWYAYNDFREDLSGQNVRSFAPATNKVGLSGRIFLGDGFALNANYRYTSSTRSLVVPATMTVEPSHRLDLTLSKKIAGEKGEIMVGVTDLLNRTNGPNGAMGQITAFETPGRMFFARLQLKH